MPFPPEADLLLHCARSQIGPDRATAITRLVSAGIHWRYLLDLARPHGMRPFLYRHLSTVCPDAVPDDTLDHLGDEFQKNAARNLFLTRELRKLLDLLEAASIPVVPYKGPILAVTVYGDLALREFCDLDILVQPHDVAGVRELLLTNDYVRHFPLTPAQEAVYLPHLGEYKFHRCDGKVLLEVHWELTPRDFPFPLASTGLWDRLRAMPFGGRTVRNLSPEDLFLFLCAHGSRHVWSRLEWLCGVAELIRVHTDMDWGLVLRLAEQTGSTRTLLLGLYLATDLLDTPLPEAIRSRVQTDPTVRALAAEVGRQLFREPLGAASDPGETIFRIRVRERWQDRARCCLSRIIAPTVEDASSLALPAALSFMYYPIRPVRLLGKHAMETMRRRSWKRA